MQEHEAHGSSNTKITTGGTDQLKALVGLIGNDAFAMSFQSVRQYREALLNAAPAVQREPLRHPATPSFFEYPSFDESANFDPVPAVQGEPVGFIRHVHYHGIARNSEECEVVLYGNAKNMPEGVLLYTAPQPAPNAPTPTFQPGDRVRKTKGSQWKGRVVGTYSTILTPEGYAVESDTEKGSVQIYPVGALELVGERP